MGGRGRKALHGGALYLGVGEVGEKRSGKIAFVQLSIINITNRNHFTWGPGQSSR